ncbi:cation transporter [Methylobacterium sp. C25]|uniref:cation diffusion facilitator family transporter n=1 Tax=Methylobacterium sp. C25 TaxID=2721622 RepID=UPI001F18DF36|nr:cation diffusion facilitator family transporter [Methylobacterium sp. C25]MCE4223201.1 cation transporter [Methylobacterium sp. C25]
MTKVQNSYSAHHDHDHPPGAHHHHVPKDFGRAFAIGIGLNFGFVVIEAGYGILSNSVALIADAGHNLSDVLGLVAAWVASVLVRKRPSVRFTYGLRGSSILAALFNAVFLLIATGAIILEALQRFFTTTPVAGTTVMVVAAIGIAINGFTAWLFAAGGKNDINIRGAYLHMMADAVVSLGVVLSGFVILVTGINWIDPLVSIVISLLIVWTTWGLLRDSLSMALSAVPPGIDPVAVRAMLNDRPGVSTLHDMHIWSMSTTEIALTAHLVTDQETLSADFLRETARELRERFGIVHATLQIEQLGIGDCTLPTECEG